MDFYFRQESRNPFEDKPYITANEFDEIIKKPAFGPRLNRTENFEIKIKNINNWDNFKVDDVFTLQEFDEEDREVIATCADYQEYANEWFKEIDNYYFEHKRDSSFLTLTNNLYACMGNVKFYIQQKPFLRIRRLIEERYEVMIQLVNLYREGLVLA